MPSYKVLKKGFYQGTTYDPEGKRRVLHRDKPFTKKNGKEDVPSWLEPIKVSKKDADKAKKQQAEDVAAASKKKKQDREDIETASFIDDVSESSKVETL